MEKRVLLAFILTFGFLFFWGHFVKPPSLVFQEEPQKIIPANKAALTEPAGEPTHLNLPQIKIGDLFITYSPTGGYIETAAVGNPENLLPFRKIGFIAENKTKEYRVEISTDTLHFAAADGEKKTFIFQKYNLTIKFSSPPPAVTLFVNYLYPNRLEQQYQEIFYAHAQNIKRFNPKKITPGLYRNVSFAGGRDRYYCFALARGAYDLNWLEGTNQGQLQLLSPPAELFLYLGPQEEKLLRQQGLEGIVYYGFFHGIGTVLVRLLHFFYALTKNWGLGIIFFAGFIYLCLFPFTSKSTKAMQKMQRIQPELEALKIKYKDDHQKFGREQLALFKKYKINPLGGCLPLFLQFPIFIALYQVLFRFVELKGATFLWIKDLSLPDQAFHLPFKIPLLGEYLNILPIFIMILGLIQQKITAGKTGSAEQKSMGLFLSVFLGVIFYNFPSALVLYWFIQNLLTFVYQLRISQVQTLQLTSS